MNAVPNVGKIFVRTPEAGKSSGGIFIPDNAAKETIREAQVVAVGAPRRVNGDLIAMALEVGNLIVVDTLGSLKIKLDLGNGKEEITVVRGEDVLARLQ